MLSGIDNYLFSDILTIRVTKRDKKYNSYLSGEQPIRDDGVLAFLSPVDAGSSLKTE